MIVNLGSHIVCIRLSLFVRDSALQDSFLTLNYLEIQYHEISAIVQDQL